MPPTKKKDEEVEKVPHYGGYSRVLQSSTKGKRPFDNPEGVAEPRALSEEDANREPGFPPDVKEELAKEKKARAEVQRKKAEARGETPVAKHSDDTDTRAASSIGSVAGGRGRST